MDNKIKMSDVGTLYIASNNKKEVMGKVVVIEYDEYEKKFGKYAKTRHKTYHNYMIECKNKIIHNNNKINHVSWYITNDKDYDLLEALDIAIKEKSNIVVVQRIK